MASTVRFTPDLNALARQMEQRIERLPDALMDFAQGQAGAMEGDMKANAPWEDQTTAARGGLTAEVTREGDTIRIVLYGIEEHNIYLELGTAPRDNGHPGMAPRPIIQPTMRAHQTEIAEGAAALVRAALLGRAAA